MLKLETEPEKAQEAPKGLLRVEQYNDMKMLTDGETGSVVYDLTDDEDFFDFIFQN